MLLDIANWGEQELRDNGYTDEKEIARSERLVQIHLTDGDVTDMLALGYFVNEFGITYREHTTSGTYLDLEYYDEPLVGEKRFLTALSNYTRGKIDIATLANAYRILSDETRVEYIKKYSCRAYLDEHWKLAGLK